ncbi:FHA domain-containing protein [Streptomyces sp. NPDC001380]|uniref:FHA domain-containing protein n=1 Tax=Streptomyces sp. NPDC001380 TaxID=3364566 RepID=UPI00369C066E
MKKQQGALMPICPRGHDSHAEDWCDVCGFPMAQGGRGGPSYAAAPPPSAGAMAPPPFAEPEATDVLATCPICRTPQSGRYCEECGYDYDLSSPPRQPAAEPPRRQERPEYGYGHPGQPGQPAADPFGAAPYADRGAPAAPAQAPGAGSRGGPGAGGPGVPGSAPSYGGHDTDFRLVPPTRRPGEYGQADPYGGPEQYGRPEPYGPSDRYGQSDGYGQYGQPREASRPDRPDHTPEPPQPARTAWVAVVSADREYFEQMMARSGPEAQGLYFPPYCPERRIPMTGRGQLRIGRRSHHRGTVPEIDLSVPPEDPGASHQHALLQEQPDGGWILVDQDSTNGTTVNGGADPVSPHTAVPLRDGDRIHVGAWTTITVHRV